MMPIKIKQTKTTNKNNKQKQQTKNKKQQTTNNKQRTIQLTNIQKMLIQGEGLTIEFKRAKNELPSSLFETVCAFLNRSGGTILLGISDDKTIEGVDPEFAGTLCKNIANLSNNPQKLFPAFLLTATTIEFRSKTLIHVFVPISSQVHKTNGKIFDRSEDGDFELKTDEQIKKLYNRKSILYTENRIYPYLTEEHFAKGIVERVRRMIKNNRPDHPHGRQVKKKQG